MRIVEELSESIISMLYDRAGFDDWWDTVADDIQEDILEDMQEVITEWLEN